MNIFKLITKLKNNKKAAVAIEYALILALMTLALIVGLTNFNKSTTVMYNNLNNEITTATAR